MLMSHTLSDHEVMRTLPTLIMKTRFVHGQCNELAVIPYVPVLTLDCPYTQDLILNLARRVEKMEGALTKHSLP